MNVCKNSFKLMSTYYTIRLRAMTSHLLSQFSAHKAQPKPAVEKAKNSDPTQPVYRQRDIEHIDRHRSTYFNPTQVARCRTQLEPTKQFKKYLMCIRYVKTKMKITTTRKVVKFQMPCATAAIWLFQIT